jgi:hypothetical protein
MRIGASVGQNADEDPSIWSGFAKKSFRVISLHKKIIKVGLVFLVVFTVNSLAFYTIQAKFSQTIKASPQVVGNIVQPVSLNKVIREQKTQIKQRTVNCRLGYSLVPKLTREIHRTMANCFEQRLLAQIAYRESTGGIHLDNPASSASGPFQFLDSTWRSSCARFGNKASFRAQTRCTLSLIKTGSYRHHWALVLR